MNPLIFFATDILRTGNPLIDWAVIACITALYTRRSTIWAHVQRWLPHLIASHERNSVVIRHARRDTPTDFKNFCWLVGQHFPRTVGKLHAMAIDGDTHYLPAPGTQARVDFAGTAFDFCYSEDGTGAELQTFLTITAPPDRDCTHIFQMLRSVEAMRASLVKWSCKVVHHDMAGHWMSSLKLPNTRTFDNIALPLGVGEELAEDLDMFLQRETWYADKGIPYKRGYLFHGPPGCGKSSLVRAISNRSQRDVHYLNLANFHTEDDFRHAITHIPINALVVLEDVDCMKHDLKRTDTRHTAAGDDGREDISLSALLNFLDGVNSVHGQIVIMTTNDASKLDPALKRPGRCDFTLRLGPCTEDAVHKMFHLFYGEAVQLPRKTAWEKITPSEVMAHMYSHHSDVDRAKAKVLAHVGK